MKQDFWAKAVKWIKKTDTEIAAMSSAIHPGSNYAPNNTGGSYAANTTHIVPNTTYTGTAYVPTTGVTSILTNATPMGPTSIRQSSTNHVFSLSNVGKEIVRLTKEGEVIWDQGIKIDEAAESFATAIRVGAEISAGITQNVKLKMRDSVFEDLIAIAKEKGSLSADDLTYLLQASKIVEKLKGGK